jgi:hypothetical protein
MKDERGRMNNPFIAHHSSFISQENRTRPALYQPSLS